MVQSAVKIKENPTILAIETSCDETSVAVTRETSILSNSVFSQTEIHKEFGGVVPDLARTAHKEKFEEIYLQALKDSKVDEGDIDVIAVTVGPGLAIALEVGINKSKEIAERLKIPLIVVNHMEGHLVSVLAGQSSEVVAYPVLGALISGGHTEFVRVDALGSYEKIGQTLDDAAGEAFDKVSNMLGLGYPGGPKISKRAEEGLKSLNIKIEQVQQSKYVRAYEKKSEQLKYELPIPMAFSPDLNMSYSGLKTAVKQMINQLSKSSEKLNIRQTGENVKLSETQLNEISAVFEQAAVATILMKLEKALKLNPEIKEVWLGGGVVANKELQRQVSSLAEKYSLTLRLPPEQLLTADNAGMIGIAAGLLLNRVEESDYLENGIYTDPATFDQIDRMPGLSL